MILTDSKHQPCANYICILTQKNASVCLLSDLVEDKTLVLYYCLCVPSPPVFLLTVSFPHRRRGEQKKKQSSTCVPESPQISSAKSFPLHLPQELLPPLPARSGPCGSRWFSWWGGPPGSLVSSGSKNVFPFFLPSWTV